MTASTLRSTTLATIENYRNAGLQAARAYRLGGHRLLHAVNSGLEQKVDSRTAPWAPQITDTLAGLRGRIADVAAKGITQVAQRTEQVVDFGSDSAKGQVTQVASWLRDWQAGAASPLLANGLQAAARLTLPGAKVALAVSGKLSDGADGLSRLAKGKSTAVAKTARSAKAAAKKTTRRAKSAARSSTRPMAEMIGDVAAKTARATTRRINQAERESVAAVGQAAKSARKTTRAVAKSVKAASAQSKRAVRRTPRKAA